MFVFESPKKLAKLSHNNFPRSLNLSPRTRKTWSYCFILLIKFEKFFIHLKLYAHPAFDIYTRLLIEITLVFDNFLKDIPVGQPKKGFDDDDISIPTFFVG